MCSAQSKEPRTLITAVIGSDRHTAGTRSLGTALERAGFRVVSMASLAPPFDFVSAAVETSADAILVFSLYAQGELDFRGFREFCIEAGIGEILIYVGGNLVEGNEDWGDVEGRFLNMGFDRAFPPETSTNAIVSALERDFLAPAGGIRGGHP